MCEIVRVPKITTLFLFLYGARITIFQNQNPLFAFIPQRD